MAAKTGGEKKGQKRTKVPPTALVRIGRGKYTEKHGVVSDLAVKVQAEGYKIYPKTVLVLNGILVKAEKLGNITGLKEKKIVGAALAAAGIELAKSRNRNEVKPKYLKLGFDKILRAGGGNCQPHLCVRRSILSRTTEELESKLPTFTNLTRTNKR